MPDVSQAPGTQKTQEKLPPGMVIGPDGKPCKICTSFRNWRIPKQSASNPRASSLSSSKNPSSDASFAAIAGTMGALAGTSAAPAAPTRPDTPPEGCPPDVEQLGRATWTFLHTTAAYYPETPSPVQRTRMLGLLFALPVLYPCSWCATHLGEEMQRHPPDVSGRAGLSRWLCMRHNEVNERLGKPVFDCSLKSTDERWKDGPSDGSCD
ncbi:hypothetical protein M0805_004599 [Coniferiporia weirii]|nr:hypothetical protein M0805_004599 [Coniferiporia weirii]